MDVFQLRQGRYLLYLDILGFKQSVRNRSAREVYEIVDRVLSEFRLRESRIRNFRTLYFSDTIIFYQDPVGWGRWAFSDIYAIAGLAWAALAAHEIPCRGAASFGEFFVKLDSHKQHSIFFGEALGNWTEWQDSARQYVASPELIDSADSASIQKLLTTHIRKDRFCEGHLAAMFENGHVVSLLRRLRIIRDGMRR